MVSDDTIQNVINNNINNNIVNREINNNNLNPINEIPNTTNNINFLNPVNNGRQSNNVNINNYLSKVNGVFEFFVNPLKKTILNLKDEIKKLKNEINEKEEKIEELDNKCSVCFTNKSNIVFIPCGHLCMCNICNNRYIQHNMSFCPICRSDGDRYFVYT